MIEHFQHDKSTIFSIVPFAVFEFKPGLYPGSFTIPPCMDDKTPSRKVIGSSEHLMTIGGKKEPVRIITPSFQIAKSIVDDFLDGQMWTSEEGHPGIVWLHGNISLDTFLSQNEDIYNSMKVVQKNWFIRLCKETDNQWSKHHHHRVASDQAKFAARALQLDPEWMRAEDIALNYNKCPACNTMNDPGNIICSSCKYILDKSRYKKEDFAA